MIHVLVSYNPYTRKLNVIINNEAASPYGAIKKLDGQPFLKWAFRIFDAISQDINEAYEMTYTGREIEYELLEAIAANCRECCRLNYQAPYSNQSALQRINILNRLTVNGIAPMLPRRRLEIGVLGDVDIDTFPKPISNRFMLIKFKRVVPDESKFDHCLTFAKDANVEGVDQLRFVQIVVEEGTVNRTLFRNEKLIYSVVPSQVPSVVLKILELCVYPELVESWIYEIETCGAKVDEQILKLREIDRRIRIEVPEVMEVGKEYPLQIHGDISASDLELQLRSSVPHVVYFTGRSIALSETGNIQIQLYDSLSNMVLHDGMIRGVRRNKVKNMEISPSSIEMTNGDIRSIGLKIMPEDADNKSKIEWDSSNAFIAYEENGKVVARGEGECTISANCEGIVAECRIVVYPRVQRFEVLLDETMIERGQVTHFKIEQYPKEALLKNYSIRVFPSSIATFDMASKVIQGNMPGHATIEATDENGNCRRVDFEVVASQSSEKKKTADKKSGLFNKLFGGN